MLIRLDLKKQLKNTHLKTVIKNEKRFNFKYQKLSNAFDY